MTYDERCGSARGRGGKLAKEYEWGEEPHLTAISEKELRARLEKSFEEERAIIYLWRVLQGRIDLIRAELIRRGGVTLPPEGLAWVLLGEGRLGGGAS
jgi:hypothetical protein